MRNIFGNKQNVFSKMAAIVLVLTLIFFASKFIYEQFIIKDYQKRLKEAPVGSFVRTGDMKFPRSGHSAFKLKDGKVLIVGGYEGVEIFDPEAGQFRLINKKLKYYYAPTQNSLVLENGDIFIGGYYSFSPKRLKFKRICDDFSYFSSSVLLPDGNVFTGTAKGSFLYNPKTNKLESYYKNLPEIFNEPGVLKFANLDGGKIFVAGFDFSNKNPATDLDFTQFYLWDYKTNNFKDLGKTKRSAPFLTLTLIKGNKVLITGGGEKVNPLIYDANTNKFTETAKPNFIRAFSPRVLTLKNGNILLVGGETKPQKTIYSSYLYDDMFIEIYNPKTNKFLLKSKTPRRFLPAITGSSNFAIVELDDGNILISGGNTVTPPPGIKSCLIYKIGDKTNDQNN